MQVRYGEGLAIHTDPESCAGIREGAGEALTGARIGGVSSGKQYSPGCRCRRGMQKATG